MTRLDPSLRLSRLIVSRNGAPVYDESFHAGVNIIRGENGSGKSTISDFIFYALGGERHKWNKHAAMCDSVTAEVLVNGQPISLRREVSEDRQRPMTIFWGTVEDSMSAALPEFQTYPYASKGSKQSFSNVLFEAMNIPEVKGELASRITMHQILRLMYADQQTPHTRMFMSEQFDSPVLREAVGNFLIGAYDNRRYEAEIELRELRTSFKVIDQQLKSFFKLVDSGQAPPSESFVIEQKREKNAERAAAYESLRDLEGRPAEATVDSSQFSELEKDLRDARAKLSSARDGLRLLEFDIHDSREFIESLESNLAALHESEAIRASLGEMPFVVCPSCLSPIEEPDSPNSCRLCKTSLGTDREAGSILRLQRELTLQIRESKELLSEREDEFASLSDQQPALSSGLQASQARYDDWIASSRSTNEAQIAEIQRRIGFLDGELQHLDSQLELARTIDRMTAEKARLNGEVSALEVELNALVSTTNRRTAKARDRVRTHVATMLQRDLTTEDEFTRAVQENVDFDFATERVQVENREIFSASSMVVVRNAFRMALLLQSLESEEARLPRFIMIDSVEDKGMQDIRSQELQLAIANLSEEQNVEHQIIFTTAMISEGLEDSDLTVGDHYTHENKSLRIRSGNEPEPH